MPHLKIAMTFELIYHEVPLRNGWHWEFRGGPTGDRATVYGFGPTPEDAILSAPEASKSAFAEIAASAA